MKKYVAILAAIIASAAVSQATISVNWISSDGVDDPNTGVGGVPDLPIGSLVQLIWSADAILGPLNDATPLAPQGGDVLLDSQSTTLVGGFAFFGTYPEALASVVEATYLSGYVYIRAFGSAAPGVGDWYGESGLVGNPLTDQDPTPSTPDTVDIAPAGGGVFTLPNQIVPEPSVLALLGIGGVLLAARRMRKA